MKCVMGLVVIVLLLGASGQASADMIVNGDFETGDWTGWIVTESAPDVAYSADTGGFQTTQVSTNLTSGDPRGDTYWVTAHGGTYCAVFGGFETYTDSHNNTYTDPAGDTLVQTVTTTPGTSYSLAFWVNDEKDSPCRARCQLGRQPGSLPGLAARHHHRRLDAVRSQRHGHWFGHSAVRRLGSHLVSRAGRRQPDRCCRSGTGNHVVAGAGRPGPAASQALTAAADERLRMLTAGGGTVVPFRRHVSFELRCVSV